VTFAAILVSTLSLTSGLHGVVMRGPVTPVCRVDVPCSAPAEKVTLRFVRGDHLYRATTDAKGRYRVTLPPGSYRVSVASARFGFKPSAVVVPRDRFALQNFSIDTGIR
jgi:hypothetical protein